MKKYNSIDQIKDAYANDVPSSKFVAPPAIMKQQIVEAIDAAVDFVTGDKEEQRRVVTSLSNEDIQNIHQAVRRFNDVAIKLKSAEALRALVNIALSVGYGLGSNGNEAEEQPPLEWSPTGKFLYNLDNDGTARYMIAPVGNGPTVVLIYLDEETGSTLGEFGNIEGAKSAANSHYYNG